MRASRDEAAAPGAVVTEIETEVRFDRLSQRRDSLRRRVLAIADAVALLGAALTIALVAPVVISRGSEALVACALPLWILLNKLLGLYDRDANLIHKSTLDELPRLGRSVLLGTVVLYLAWPLTSGPDLGRHRAVIFALAALALLSLARVVARRGLQARLAPDRCLIVGSDSVARLVADKIGEPSRYSVEILGFVDERRDGASEDQALGDVSELGELCTRLSVSRLIVAFAGVSSEALLEVVSTARQRGLRITVVPRLFEVVGNAVEIDQIQGMTLHGLRGMTRTRSSLMLKRGIDLCASAAGLIALSPLLAMIATAIKLDSPGPVLFAQRRIGRRGAPFRMLKFRSMTDGADDLKVGLAHLNEASGPMFKIAEDPRVTKVGRFLRRHSLDELPQLVNVLRGEMSLVGPRPLVPAETEMVIGRHRSRLDITPGVTGPWQVMGRTSIPFEEMVQLDYLFVAEWSLWNDVKLLLRTVPVVLRGEGF